jgi:Rrf2 family transcriptional regulator, cysteine metabolism repressor
VRLSAKSEYACLALIDLSEHFDKGVCRISEISRRKSIPRKFLEQILLSLKQAGYLKSRRGTMGGYRLAKKPRDITLAEIVRLLDGPLAPVGSASKYFYQSTPIEKSKKLLDLFKEIRDLISRKMEKTTFADLLP